MQRFTVAQVFGGSFLQVFETENWDEALVAREAAQNASQVILPSFSYCDLDDGKYCDTLIQLGLEE